MKFKIVFTIVFCLLLQAILVPAHSHRRQLTDSDYFVRPMVQEKTTGLIYSGRYQDPKHPDSWKWIALGDVDVRYRGKILIYRRYSKHHRHCSEYFQLQHRRNPKHHYSASSGRRRRSTLESWQISTHPLGFKKLIFRHYVVYYTGHAEIHVEIHKGEKTERVKPKPKLKPKPKPKPKPKLKPLAPNCEENATCETRERKQERRRAQCNCR